MPVPILKIPIDDAAFQRYIAAFQKYQAQLEAQPEMWKGINDSIGGMALAGAAVAAEIAHQAEETRKVAAEEAKRSEALKKAAKEKSDADKAEANRDKEAAQRRKHAIDQVKEYSRSLADAAVNLGKWAIIGEGASLAAGALTFWGLDRFVADIGNQRRSAQGLNVSMGQQQGASLYLQRYFDVNSALANVATAQETPGQWGLFRMMGVNPQGKDPAQLTNEMAVAARRMFINDRENLALAGAQGLTQIFSPEDLRRLAATPEGELKASIAQSNKYGANSGLSDEVGRKWQNFLINLDTAGLKLKNVLVDKLTVLEPNLEILIGKFTELAVTVLDRIDFKQLGDGLDAFTKYIGGKQFQDDFKTFVDDVGLIAKKIADALVLFNFIPNPAAGTPAPSGVPNAFGPPPAAGPIGLIGGGTPGTGLYGVQAEHWAAQQFFKWGWAQNHVRGILSNDDSESGFNPFAKGDYVGGKPTAFGIGQWHADRQALYASLFGHTMQSVASPQQALREQVEFQQWELTSADPRNHFKKAGDDLRKTRSDFAAGYEVSMEYEKPKARQLAATARGVQAALLVTIKNQTGASVATTVNAAAGG